MRRATLVALTVGLVAVGLSAQKKVKPPPPPPAPVYVWTASLPAADDGYNIFGSGDFVSGGSLGTGGSVGVKVVYYPPTLTSLGRTDFVLSLSGVVDGVKNGTWIGFDEISGAWNDGVPTCGFPTFEDGVLIPGTRVAFSEDCIVGFLSQKHPQLPYSDVMLLLRVPAFNFEDVKPEQSVRLTSGSLAVIVDGHVDDVGLLSSVYGSHDEQSGFIDIEHWAVVDSGEDVWTTTVTLPMRPYELAKVLGKRGTIGSVVPAYTTTDVVTTVVKWTRRIVQ